MADIKIKNNTKTKNKTGLTNPRMWNVVFHNDDKTPMDFVIAILQELFAHNDENAVKLTMEVHEKDKAVVGTYIHEIAEQKATDTITVARKFDYPLKVEIYPE